MGNNKANNINRNSVLDVLSKGGKSILSLAFMAGNYSKVGTVTGKGVQKALDVCEGMSDVVAVTDSPDAMGGKWVELK